MDNKERGSTANRAAVEGSANDAKKKNEGIKRVLIVDDNRDNALTLGVLLRSEGYVVHLAKDGSEALRLAATFRPDVALVDLLMPGQSGFDVAGELQRRYRDECPVLIAITGHDSADTQEQAQASGFHRFLAKPCEPNALLHLIESFDARS